MLPLNHLGRFSAPWSPYPNQDPNLVSSFLRLTPFHLSAKTFPRIAIRFLALGFHLAGLRTNLGPGAKLRRSARRVLRLHASLCLWCHSTS